MSTNIAAQLEVIQQLRGEKVALRYPDGEVSHGWMHRRSVFLADWLADQGVVPDSVVAIVHDKGPDAFALMIACLRLGAAYVNIDPNAPSERLQRILRLCGASLLVDFVGNGESSVLPPKGLSEDPQRHVILQSASDRVAYIVFTSGSTGEPKGVAISHANLSAFGTYLRRRFEFHRMSSVITNVNPMHFDNSVFDFYSAFLSGSTLVPVPDAIVRNPPALVEHLQKTKPTFWFSVPSLILYLMAMKQFSSDRLPTLRQVAFGGEGFPMAHLIRLRGLVSDRVELINVYGPSECTCICSAHLIELDDLDSSLPLPAVGLLGDGFYGTLTSDTGDQNFGELTLFGPQVGLGYVQSPDLTAERFVMEFDEKQLPRIGYRTGDFFRSDERGRLHFMGRADDQVKLMGHRIELGEIQHALLSVDSVREAQAELIGDGPNARLVAFISPSDVSLAHVQVRLRELLPGYMIPKRIRLLEELPKNSNGKVDRVQLKSLEAQ